MTPPGKLAHCPVCGQLTGLAFNSKWSDKGEWLGVEEYVIYLHWFEGKLCPGRWKPIDAAVIQQPVVPKPPMKNPVPLHDIRTGRRIK